MPIPSFYHLTHLKTISEFFCSHQCSSPFLGFQLSSCYWYADQSIKILLNLSDDKIKINGIPCLVHLSKL